MLALRSIILLLFCFVGKLLKSFCQRLNVKKVGLREYFFSYLKMFKSHKISVAHDLAHVQLLKLKVLLKSLLMLLPFVVLRTYALNKGILMN